MTETVTPTTDDTITRLALALAEHKRAGLARPEDNPFHQHALKDMASAGLRRSGDRYPAQNMAVHGGAGLAMEEARFQVQADAKADTGAKRKATRKARAARKAQFEAIAASTVQPDPERMQQAWLIMVNLLPVIQRIADSKRRWAARYLGDVTDDVAGIVIESMALLVAKSDKDLDVLEISAQQIGQQAERSGLIPGEQLSEDERKERKRIAKGRKWLMQVANNRVQHTLIDVYLRKHNLRWENIDLIATIIDSINGPGEDPMHAKHKADRAPAFLGTKFQTPGGIDPALLTTAISAAITERGLDRMVELLLAGTRSDGAFPWTERAEEVFMAAPGGEGPYIWQLVCEATTGRNRDGREWQIDRARKARGDAARNFVRSQFDWLPGLIVSIVEAFDPKRMATFTEGGPRPDYATQTVVCPCCESKRGQYALAPTPGGATLPNIEGQVWPTVPVYYVPAGSNAWTMIASDFEVFYKGDEPDTRLVLSPILRFSDATEAARVLLEHVAALVTGEDLVASVVDA